MTDHDDDATPSPGLVTGSATAGAPVDLVMGTADHGAPRDPTMSSKSAAAPADSSAPVASMGTTAAESRHDPAMSSAVAEDGLAPSQPLRVRVVEFTDPGCPYAFSAEPHRLRLRWLFGDQLAWELRMVGIAKSRQDNVDRGLDPGMIADQAVGLVERYGMPLYTRRRGAVPATRAACSAVVATRRHAPSREWLLLRRLRVLAMSGGMLDSPALIRQAADEVGLHPETLDEWVAEPETEALLAEDFALARAPSSAGLAMPHKLGRDGEQQRYTPPSYELSAEATFTVPGMQSSLAYETVIANLAPTLRRRPEPDDVVEVLRWAGYPLATQEVAEVCGVARSEAREQLVAAGAVATAVCGDAYWNV